MTVVTGLLLERGRRRLLVGVYVPRGILCELASGERDGRRIVDTIRRLPEERLVWPRIDCADPPRYRL
jgi:hypothetical protein